MQESGKPNGHPTQQRKGLKKVRIEQARPKSQKKNNFLESPPNQFEISHGDAISLITEEENKEFLKAQREDGRREAVIGRDMILTYL